MLQITLAHALLAKSKAPIANLQEWADHFQKAIVSLESNLSSKDTDTEALLKDVQEGSLKNEMDEAWSSHLKRIPYD